LLAAELKLTSTAHKLLISLPGFFEEFDGPILILELQVEAR
jgi:hypothetical protein